jgi:tRNA (adenine37-N6)-methyltransferase
VGGDVALSVCVRPQRRRFPRFHYHVTSGLAPRPGAQIVVRMKTFTVTPIGVVRSPFTDTKQVPKGPGAKHAEEGVLEIRPEYEAGLADIEGFSHLFVLWIFDGVDGYDLTAHPPTDNKPHGVFATRSPRRPNAIGLTVVELLGRDGTKLRVRGVDMLDGSPIIDIKPYLSSVPAERLKRGWLEGC